MPPKSSKDHSSAARASGLRKPPPSSFPADPDTDHSLGKRGKSHWQDDHLDTMLDLVEKHHPKGSVQWINVSDDYNRRFRGKSEACFHRTGKAMLEKWRKLLDTALPTGCGELSMMTTSMIENYSKKQQHVIRAHQIAAEISDSAGIESYQSDEENPSSCPQLEPETQANLEVEEKSDIHSEEDSEIEFFEAQLPECEAGDQLYECQ
jgi:hypothetical protein